MSVVPSISSAIPSPSPSDQASQPAGFGTTAPALSSSAALYLYTFLATLILLLTISAVIIARSYCIRRRQRQQVEEAIRNGTYVPPAPVRPVNLKERPVLYDVYLGGDGVGGLEMYNNKRRSMSEVESVDTDLKGGHNHNETLGSMMPLAAVAEKADMLTTSAGGTPLSEPRRPHNRVWIPRRLRQRQGATADVPLTTLSGISSPPTTNSGSNSSSLPDSPEPESVQLALFIAMPRQQQPHERSHPEEEPLPSIEIGFTEVCLRSKDSKSGGDGDSDKQS